MANKVYTLVTKNEEDAIVDIETFYQLENARTRMKSNLSREIRNANDEGYLKIVADITDFSARVRYGDLGDLGYTWFIVKSSIE